MKSKRQSKIKGQSQLTTKLVLQKLPFALILAGASFATAGTWTHIKTQPSFLNPPFQCAEYKNANCSPGSRAFGGVDSPMLLTDGRILFSAVQVDNSLHYKFLEYTYTPDIHGSYLNGTWKLVANIPNAASTTNPKGWGPQYFSTAVLPDSRVVYAGGLYSGYHSNIYGLDNKWFREASNVAVYNPLTNKWTVVKPPSFFKNLYQNPPNRPGRGIFFPIYPPDEDASKFVNAIGDSQSVVLPTGSLMIASKLSKQAAILNAKTLTWKETGAGKKDLNASEGWTLLPNGKVLTIDCSVDYFFGLINSYPTGPQNTELYNPATGKWTLGTKTVGSLTYNPSATIGAAVLMADGRVLAMGGGGQTSIYNSTTGKWAAGPTLPTTVYHSQTLNLSAANTGAALLPNGNVLLSTQGNLSKVNPPWNYSQPPIDYFEFDGTKLIKQPTIPDSSLGQETGLLLLPTGQVLEYDGQTDIEIYTPSTSVDTKRPSYVPVITSAPKTVKRGVSYVIKGILFNGVSQGGFVGNIQAATNYPLLRITNNKTKHVFYSRTYNFSSMAVASRKTVSASFTVPKTQELGASVLEVVTNGKPSAKFSITVQ